MQTAVYNESYLKVYNACYRILGDVHEAEDQMHEAFIDAFRKIELFRGEAALSTWICRIAINKCLDHLKKRRIKIDFEIASETLTDISDDSISTGTYDVDRVQRAMGHLPEGCRVVFCLYIFEEMNHAEIAEKLGIKEASSRAQYARAKNKIKELVNSVYV
jgi:RNA polymerase sigma-70 factor (ECF subfamily)